MKQLLLSALMMTGLNIAHATESAPAADSGPSSAAAEAMESKSFFETRTLEDLQKIINIDGTVSDSSSADAPAEKGAG